MSSNVLEVLTPRTTYEDSPPVLPLHVVVATNFIAPHTLSGWLGLDRRVEKLTILLNTAMETNRNWQPEFGNLDVRIQRTTTLEGTWGSSLGFKDANFVHIPWDTIGQLRKLKPDVVISAELGPRSMFCAMHRLMNPKVPLIYWCGLSEHTEKDRGWARHLMRKGVLGRADAVLINGASGQRYLEKMGLPSDRIHHYSYATIPAMYEAGSDHRPESAAHKLVYVGSLIDRKGVLPFTKALSSWASKHPDRVVEFTLLGGGPVEDELKQLSKPDNLRLDMRGQSDYEAIIAGLGDAGIFAFPSLADEWGLAVNEAMATGLPVLGCVYSQAVEELVEYGVHGWTFRTDFEIEMEQAIDDALSTPVAEVEKMRAVCRERVRALSPEKTAEDVVTAIRAVMGDRLNETW